LVLLVPNVLSIAALLILAVALEVQVRLVEEPYLHATHGSEYARYQSSFGRFLPGLGTHATP
jgi:protein-S-isoprenylcysteine O-methyltransferase Ste14